MTRREFINKYPTEAQMAADICHRMMMLEKTCYECPIKHQCISNNINPKYIIDAYRSMCCMVDINENDILDILEK